jgi:hypothetical protein
MSVLGWLGAVKPSFKHSFLKLELHPHSDNITGTYRGQAKTKYDFVDYLAEGVVRDT